MSSVSQDGSGIIGVCRNMTDKVASFSREYAQMFEKIDKAIGMADRHAAWSGPNAETFIKNLDLKKADFEKCSNNLHGVINNLASQANSWNSFEGQ